MNISVISVRSLQKAMALIALFALVFSPFINVQLAQAAVGEMNTVSGSCGAPVNVNSYEEGEAVLLDGKNYDPNTEYDWDITEVGGANPTVLASGQITTDGDGAFCFTAIASLAVGTNLESPYKADVGGKTDNFSVEVDSDTSGILTVIKDLVNEPDGVTADDFSFTVDGGSPIQFEADGSNAVVLNINDAPFTIVEVEANGTGYATTYGTCTDIALTDAGATCTVTNTYEVEDPEVNLAISKTVDNSTPVEAGQVVYTLTVTNNGPDTATNVTVTDTLPAGVTFVSSNPATTSSPMVWNVGSLANGASTAITVTVSVNEGTEGTTIINSASVTNDVEDTLPSDNIDSESITVEILGCTDDSFDNYDPTATQDDGSCANDDQEVITLCKYNAETDAPIAGWGMTLTNDKVGEANVSFDLVTGDNGCISQAVDSEDGPFYATEDTNANWTQDEVTVSGGVVLETQEEGVDMCRFFAPVIALDAPLALVAVDLPLSYDCNFYNDENEDARYTLTVVTTGDGEGNVVTGGEDTGIACYSETQEGEEWVNNCSETYPSGTVVTLVATADEGSNFDSSWHAGAAGTCTGNTTPCQITIDQDRTIEAHFALNGGGYSQGSYGGGNGRNVSLRDDDDDDEDEDEPEGEVLGAATSVVPEGAPATGAGGGSISLDLQTVVAILASRRGVRATHGN
jgi:uncharacterized repeat protein (TIGR01451 family)